MMTNQISGFGSHGKMAYVNQTERNAWRREMLDQMLAKVREASISNDKMIVKKAGPPPKGSLLDVFV